MCMEPSSLAPLVKVMHNVETHKSILGPQVRTGLLPVPFTRSPSYQNATRQCSGEEAQQNPIPGRPQLAPLAAALQSYGFMLGNGVPILLRIPGVTVPLVRNLRSREVQHIFWQ